jgi:hypothetical protein
MTLTEFQNLFNFKSSQLNTLVFEEKEHTESAILLINFSYWMQKSYKKGTPRTGLVKVIFHHVLSHAGIQETVTPLTMIGAELSESAEDTKGAETITFSLVDSQSDTIKELTITAESVDVLRIDDLKEI